jgi:hypothetical protein
MATLDRCVLQRACFYVLMHTTRVALPSLHYPRSDITGVSYNQRRWLYCTRVTMATLTA